MAVLNNTGILAGASGAGGGGYEIEKSLRFNGGDDASLNKTFASGGSTTTWTLSFWIKGFDIASAVYVFTGGTGTSSYITMDAGQFRFYSSAHDLKSEARYRDPAAWYHFVVVADTTNSTDNDKTRVYVNGTRLAVGDFSTHNQPSASASLGDFGSASAHYFNKLTTGNEQDLMLAETFYIDGQALTDADFGEFNSTTGVWDPKEYAGTYGTNGFYLKFNGTDLGEDSSGNDNDWTATNLTADPGATTIVSADTFSDDVTYEKNGSTTVDLGLDGPESMFDGGETIDNYCYVGSNHAANYIKWTPATSIPDTAHNGYVWICGGNGNGNGLDHADCDVYINDSATAATHTASITQADGSNHWNYWYKYAVSGTFTSLKVKGIHALIRGISFQATPAASGTHMVDGQDHQSHPLDSGIDTSTDTPTNYGDEDTGVGGEVRGNYATWNPLTNRGVVTTSNGNLTANAVNSNYGYTLSTIPVSSGKYYCEITFEGTMAHSTNFSYIGIVPIDSAAIYGTGHDIFRANGALSIDSDSSSIRGTIGNGSSDTNNTYQSSYGFDEDDVIGIAIDCDTPQVTFYKNGTSIGTFPHAMLADKSWVLFINDWASGSDFTGYVLNAGQRKFSHAAPSGFKCLCTQNLPDPTIVDPSKYFGISTWTGNEGASRDIDGLNFQPDMVWGKNRDGNSHQLFDAVREAGVSKELTPNDTFEEGRTADPNTPVYGWLSDFNSDGFTVTKGSHATDGNFYWNQSGSGHVAWSWDAGDANTNTSVSAGGMDASLLDKSQAWGTAGTITGGTASNYGWPGVFNEYAQHAPWKIASGGGGNACHPSGGGVTTKYEFANSGLTGVTSIKLSVYDYADGSIILNEGEADEVTFTGTDYNVVKMYEDTTITTLKSISNAGGSTTGHALFGVMVNGKALIDSGNSYTIPSIASTYRANPSAGFSIVDYGQGGAGTIAHGLNAKPAFAIVKRTDDAENWAVYHKSLGYEAYIPLNTNDVQSTGSSIWNSVDHDSNSFSLGNSTWVSHSSADHIAYIWSEVENYSKFGSYTGNGDADGKFVYTGMRPAFLLIKRTDVAADWCIFDLARDGYNGDNNSLYPNSGVAENEYVLSNELDILSNGFKSRADRDRINTSGGTYIFAAFSEHPFKYSRAR